VIVALIALLGTVGNVGLTYALTVRAERRRAQEKADAVSTRQRRSLAFAASELSDRIANILQRGFLDAILSKALPLRTVFRLERDRPVERRGSQTSVTASRYRRWSNCRAR
jgi:hypothetical protein